MIRVALIGAGGHSLACHAPALRRYADAHPGKATLAALCDLDLAKATRAVERFGFERACGSVEELFNSGANLHAVVAVLPIPVMLDATGPLLKRGLPLMIEKPLGNNVAEARALAETAQRHGMARRVMVSLNRRHDPGLAMGLAWAREQGSIRHLRGTMIRSGRTEPEFVWGTGIHIIDALNHVAGPLILESVRSPGKHDSWRFATLRGRDDASVFLEIMPTGGHPWFEHIRIAGDEYWVEVQTGAAPPWTVRAFRHGKMELDATSPADEPGCVSNGTYGETAAFLDAVAEGRPLPSPGLVEALASSELAAAIEAM